MAPGEVRHHPPILVTGAHRSGTTWAGKMLAASPRIAYISEPLNLLHRPGVLRAPVRYWYPYICRENEAEYIGPLLETIAFRYHAWAEIGALRSRKDLLRMLRDAAIFIKGGLYRQRALLKDPFALFSAPWFVDRLGCQVVILVRHPAAFTSSLVRLGWSFDFRNFLSQPLLMRDYLGAFKRDMEAVLAEPGDIVVQSCLLWRIIYSVVRQFQQTYPDFCVLRHEDLSRQPLKGFADLYTTLGIPFTRRVQQSILASSSSKNPEESARDAIYTTRLDSRASIDRWKHRLGDETIRRVRDLTASVSEGFYRPEDWV